MAAWDDPGIEEVAEGVHRIPLPLPTDGLRAVNAYAIADGDRLTLVDAGWAIPEAWRALETALASLGYDLGMVSRCLATHLHRDHYTQAVALRRVFGTRVALGQDEQESLSLVMATADGALSRQLDALTRAGAGPVRDELVAAGLGDHRQEYEPPDEWLTDRARVAVGGRDLEVLNTPGHTRGHVVFLDAAAGMCFSGDHVLPHITPSIGFEAAPAASPLGDYLQSLALLRSRPDMELLPAHGPTTMSVHERIDQLLEHHQVRLAEVVRTVTGRELTAFESARALRWTRRLRTLDELDAFNRMLAITETAAHLDLLVAQGRVARTEAGDAVGYLAVERD